MNGGGSRPARRARQDSGSNDVVESSPVQSRSRRGQVITNGRRAGQRRVSDGDKRMGPAKHPSLRHSADNGVGVGRVQSVPDTETRRGADNVSKSLDIGDEEDNRRVLVVHQSAGPYTSIAAAVKNSMDGDIIAISPGRYAEAVTLSAKQLTLIGKGAREDVWLEVTKAGPCVTVAAENGPCRLENLSFTAPEQPQQVGGRPKSQEGGSFGRTGSGGRKEGEVVECVMIYSGKVTVLNCHFSGGCAGVSVRGEGTEAMAFGCDVAVNGRYGVGVYNQGRVRVRRCTFQSCGGAGVEGVQAAFGGECRVDECTFKDQRGYGVAVGQGGAGLVEHNTFTGGLRASVAVSGEADPTVEMNVIEQSRGTGVFIFDRGRGRVRANQFRECRLAAVEVRDEGSCPMVEDNWISKGQDAGVVVHSKGGATVRGNTITGCAKASITLCTGASAQVLENTVAGGGAAAVLVHTGAGGVVRGNTISSMGRAGVEVRKTAAPRVEKNVISGCQQQGVLVHLEGGGEVSGNRLADCGEALVEVREGSNVAVANNVRSRIPTRSRGGVTVEGGQVLSGGGGYGLWLRSGAQAASGNAISGCAKAGVCTGEEFAGTVRGNRVAGCLGQGVLLLNGAREVRVEENELAENELAGVEVRGGVGAVVEGNRVERGRGSGVLVCDGAGGRVADNIIRGSAKAGVVIRGEADPLLLGNQICDGMVSGVYVYDRGKGRLERNVVQRNAFHGVAVRDHGAPVLVDSKILRSGQNGIFVYAEGSARVEKCEVSGSGNAGIVVCENARAEVKECKVAHSVNGVWVYDGGGGSVTGSDLHRNKTPIRIDEGCDMTALRNKLV